MAARTHYRRKFWCDDLLSDSVNALCFSDDSRLTAATDSRGVLVVFDNQIGGPVHLAYLTPKVQVFSLLWRGASELFFGLSNGAVGALAFKSSGSQFRMQMHRALPEEIPGPVICLALLEKRRPTLALAFRDQVQLWEIRGITSWKQRATYSIDNATDSVASMAFLKNGDLAVAYQASGISIWRSQSHTRIQVPGLEVHAINSFSFALNGLALVSFENRGSGQPFTDLFRFSAQPPYGLTRVRNWPGRQKSTQTSPVPIALASQATIHLMAWAIESDKTAVLQSDGLTEQFEPSLPSGCQGEVLAHLEGSQVQMTAASLTKEFGYVATVLSTGGVLRFEVWTTDPSDATPVPVEVKQDNLSQLLWTHIEGQRSRKRWRSFLFICLSLATVCGILIVLRYCEGFPSCLRDWPRSTYVDRGLTVIADLYSEAKRIVGGLITSGIEADDDDHVERLGFFHPGAVASEPPKPAMDAFKRFIERSLQQQADGASESSSNDLVSPFASHQPQCADSRTLL